MSKKKKIIVLASMVALLVLTGCLNYFLNRTSTGSAAANSNAVTSYSDYFAASRADRETSRSETVMYYETIIGSEATSDTAKANAEAELAALVAGMETELRLETLIKALGFSDCLVTVGSENVNVIVKSGELTAQEVAQVLDVVMTETGKTIDYVRVKSMDV